MDENGNVPMQDQGDHVDEDRTRDGDIFNIDNPQFSTTDNRMERSSEIINLVLGVRLYSVDGIKERSSGNADNQMDGQMDVDGVEDDIEDETMSDMEVDSE